MFRNMVISIIFEPRTEKLTGSFRKLHNKELYNSYSSPDIIRTIKSGRIVSVVHVLCKGEVRNIVSNILIGNHERKVPPGKQWRRWKDNIKVDIK
jgi:hypothetical protein